MGGSASYRLGKKIANAKAGGASQEEINELERQRDVAKAVQKAKVYAKRYSELARSLYVREREIGISDFDYDSFNKDLAESVDLAKKLGAIANQVKPGTINNLNAISPSDIRTIGRVLGVQLRYMR